MTKKEKLKQIKYLKLRECNLMNNENVNTKRTILFHVLCETEMKSISLFTDPVNSETSHWPCLPQPQQRGPFWVLEHQGEQNGALLSNQGFCASTEQHVRMLQCVLTEQLTEGCRVGFYKIGT